jgi:hypothetical protein
VAEVRGSMPVPDVAYVPTAHGAQHNRSQGKQQTDGEAGQKDGFHTGANLVGGVLLV